jgi:hypothetical protein
MLKVLTRLGTVFAGSAAGFGEAGSHGCRSEIFDRGSLCMELAPARFALAIEDPVISKFAVDE